MSPPADDRRVIAQIFGEAEGSKFARKCVVGNRAGRFNYDIDVIGGSIRTGRWICHQQRNCGSAHEDHVVTKVA